MGPLFVLIIWAILATILSVLGGAILGKLVSYLTGGVDSESKKAINIARLLPAAGFVYLFCCVIAFSVWSTARGRDMGWGDSWDTPILDNYNLMMIDVMETGSIYNRNNQIKSQIDGIRRLEVHAPYILATISAESSFEDRKPATETSFFLLDTQSNRKINFSSLAELENASRALNIPFELEPVSTVYSEHRYTRIDLIPLVVFIVPPLFVAFYLLQGLMRIRAAGSRRA